MCVVCVEVVDSRSNNIRLRLDTTGRLTIDHTKPSDSGRYTCLLAGQSPSTTPPSTLQLRVFNPAAHLVLQSVGKDFVSVTWRGTDSTVSVVQYVITYRPTGQHLHEVLLSVGQCSK
jgi:hypothetical protein